MCYHFMWLTNHLLFFIIGLVLGGLDRVVSNIGPSCLGTTQKHIEGGRKLKENIRYTSSFSSITTHINTLAFYLCWENKRVRLI